VASLIVILAIGLVAAFWVIGAYNGLVRGRNEVKSAWSSIEVQLKRRYYNDSAMRYKNRVEVFPSNLIANMFAFQPEAFFQVDAAEEKIAPKVKF
jgi:LemA protein